MNILEKSKIVEVWLTNEDQRSSDIEDEVDRICMEWSGKKYKIAVIRSGSGDLFSSMEGLLLNNLAG
ncbi:MAG: hypothetical protein IJJ57_10410 [Ruminococcus sp.]|nr:hypothetical protein [Ruminococcus sp.]MBQ9807715.1 hypothetical protein [Ruminococcus sp.]